MSDLSGLNPTPTQLLCTLRDHCRQGSRNTRYQAGAAPYLGRSSTGWIAPACLAHSFDHLVGAGACNGGMIPRFHRAVCDYFTFGSAPVPAITRAEKPVLNDSKFSPFPFRHLYV